MADVVIDTDVASVLLKHRAPDWVERQIVGRRLWLLLTASLFEHRDDVQRNNDERQAGVKAGRRPPGGLGLDTGAGHHLRGPTMDGAPSWGAYMPAVMAPSRVHVERPRVLKQRVRQQLPFVAVGELWKQVG